MVIEESVTMAELVGGYDGLAFGQDALLLLFFGFWLYITKRQWFSGNGRIGGSAPL